MTKTAKGAFACARLDQRALEKGAVTSIPIAEVRYDRVVDWDGRLYRVQVKYTDADASHSANAVQVSLQSSGHGGLSSSSYHAGEIDAVVVYIARADILCWFEPRDFEGKTALTLRLAPPKNGQRKGIRMAADYVW
ncbi:MAG: group I intron-associated PD-(D/E)XK endonuclease [Bacteroidota bacterium]